MVSMLVTLIIVVVAAVISIGTVLIAVAVPIVIVWMMRDQLGQLGQMQITMPIASDGPALIKRTQCRSCGSPKITRSLSAYVFCDFCGELIDWDFQAALADKRSKLPGPAYEQILARTKTRLDAARTAKDAVAYEAVQREIWATYAQACPAALSPRIGDPRYREKWIAFTAAHTTACDLDDACQATLRAQAVATGAIVWDRSDPFAPKVTAATFWPLLEAVTANQRAFTDKAVSTGLLDKHPDHPPESMFLRIGTSAFAQGWIPFLKKADADTLLERSGLKGEYVRPEPVEMKSGPCPSCAAPLQVVPGAHRVLCAACGHLAGVDGAMLPCHGCGTKVQLPDSGSLFKCTSCDAELRMMRWS